MKETSSAGKLLKGAALLTIAALLTKLLGTLQKIPLQNIGGDGVFGIYNTVYPFYTLLLTLATAGFPTAVSKFVAEQEAAENRRGALQVLRVSGLVIVILGFIGAILLYMGAPILAHWIGSKQLIPALRSASPALIFVPAAAALRGYFQGLQNMLPTAVSQVAEQALRVGVMIVLLMYFHTTGADDSTVASGAMVGSAAGGVAGLIIMIYYWRRHQREVAILTQENKQTASLSVSNIRLIKELLVYGIPICLAALAVPLIGLVDTFTLPRLLQQGGIEEMSSLVQVGVYNRGIPLVQLVTMLGGSLSMLFIPLMAELKFKGEVAFIQSQTRLALRWFWLIGLASSAGLALLAEPINIMMYKDIAGTSALRWIALTAAPSTMVTITAALLQGLGAVRRPALHLAGAAVLKILLNLLLVPQLGIDGAAIASLAAYSFAAALNLALLLSTTSLRLRLKEAVLKPALLVAALALAVLTLRLGTDAAGLLHGRRSAAAAESLLGVALGAAVFAIGVLRLRVMTEQELFALPKIGPKLVRWLRRLKLLPNRS
ncbi:O-antigen/teichoic acid export membrane protein [Paenibacillus shirakamiensis]|uniref:O-antigen/teichoic acid export membrane protein n=1 Tax=Paenibacillus shirakamiensis TaxID=1265935 RepID=A0ABS4JQ05_9BACL|nr:oligosaccharide flippase family protein [Paenibacillus shirakamiensis]MBP2002709.1 O-antigen/teichoic acid export membrane protein [Paenibacillus shirakamiensis]